MRDSSVSDRSATPVPASTRMSLSSSIEVVRRCRPPIPPLHPRIRSFTIQRPSLFLIEHRHSVPARRRRIAALGGHLVGVQAVESTVGIHALKVEQTDLDLVPLKGTVLPQGLLPQLQLVENLLFNVSFHPDGFVDRDRFVPALDLDLVDLLEDHVLDELAARFSHQYSDTVVLGAPF